MLNAAIAKAVVEMESLQVVIEQGDRIGVDYPAHAEPAGRHSEPKTIQRALTILKTALHQFDNAEDVEMAEGVCTLQVGEHRILLFLRD